jgi:hypothetical protein
VLLVCRLHFASGLVKLLSGDPTWSGLTALDFHFETQPLPGPLAPFAHHLGGAVHAALTALTLGLEVVMPPLALSRRARSMVFASFVALQLGIFASGNYGFFNVLTIVLSLPLLDDDQLARLTRGAPSRLGVAPRDPSRGWGSRVRVLALATLIGLALLDLHGSLGGLVPEPFDRPLARVSSLRLTSPYGLFAVMTTERDEIVLERSEDGERWVELDLHYKPGPIDRALPIVPLHMPRLDWMLWFAALGEADDSPWVMALERAILEGRAPVRALLADAPAEAPRFVRAVRYRYRVAADGSSVWVREARGPFGPTLRAR